MKKMAIEKSRMLGTFSLPSGQQVFGELRLQGQKTLLKLRHEVFVPPLERQQVIHGQLHDLSKVSCLQCVGGRWGSTWREDEGTYYHADVFPHFVTVGSEHLQPEQPSIKAVHFAVDDLTSIFYDFDAFGHVIDSTPLIEAVVRANKCDRPIPIGDMPRIAYFTGKHEIIAVETVIGRVSVNHCPSYSMGGPEGVFIKNRMMITIAPPTPIAFDECIERTMTIFRFLSLLAGRKQGIKSVFLDIATESDQLRAPLQLSWSFAPRGHKRKDDSNQKPHPGDVPLDAVRRPDEFTTVLKDWVARESAWRMARVRYHGCLRKGNSYDVDRLIAAANMFDILPKEAVPLASEMPAELAAAQIECLAMFKKQPRGIERDGIIRDLSRMAKPTLPKKVLHRVSIVERHLGHRFPELALVTRIAVKCRNFLVHGASDDFDYVAVEPLTSYFTDALEFIFAASDLIEAGWDARAWNSGGSVGGHSFSRFRDSYDMSLAELKKVLRKTEKL